MTITIDITPELQAELMRQAATQGMALDAYAVNLLEEAVHFPVSPKHNTREAAIEQLKTFGKIHGLSLGGMTLKELRQEARP
mgnify:CR=1 FL=1